MLVQYIKNLCKLLYGTGNSELAQRYSDVACHWELAYGSRWFSVVSATASDYLSVIEDGPYFSFGAESEI